MEQGQQSPGSDLGSTASPVIETLKSGATELSREAKRASGEMLEQRVDKVFSFLDDVERAVRAAARELENDAHPQLAQLANRAAAEVSSVRRRFGASDINGMISSAESLARAHPAAALGAAFAAGFAFVRFLKSSTPQGFDGNRRK